MRLTKQLCLLCAAAALLAPPSRLPAQSAAPAGPAAANGEIAELQLSIAQAMELARTNADEVRARAAGLEAALQGERVARAALYPSLSASASGAYLANPPEGISVAKGSLGSLTVPDGTGGYKTIEMPSQDFVVVKNAEDTYFKGNLTFTQPIVAWGKIRASMDIATMEAELALTGREGAARDAAREANRAYYSAKLALESQAILEGLQTLAASIVADRSASLELGLGTKERLLSAQADRAAIDAQLVGARESATTALQSLSALTGIAAGKSIDLVSDFRDGLPALDEESLKRAALLSSTDYRSAALRLREAGRKIDLETGSAALRPDLAFFASLDASGQTPPFSRSDWTETWAWDLSLGISIQADLFDAGASAARIEEARSQRLAAAAALHGEETAARLDARKALQAALEAEATLRSVEARAAWTAELLRNAQSSAENQLSSRQDLNAAAIQDATARLELLSARYTFEEALADIDRLGQGATP